MTEFSGFNSTIHCYSDRLGGTQPNYFLAFHQAFTVSNTVNKL